MGKNVGDDLAENLTLIHVMTHGTQEQADLIRHAIRTGGLETLEQVLAVVKESGALEYTHNVPESMHKWPSMPLMRCRKATIARR